MIGLCFAGNHTATWHSWLKNNLFMISDDVVPGEAQFVKEAGYQASFQRSYVRMTVYADRWRRLN